MNVKEQSFKSDFPYFGGISFLYGIIFAFCMYRNFFGASFFLYSVATIGVLVIFMKRINIKVKKRTKAYFAAIMMCGLSTCITANEFLQLLNWCCIIFLLLLVMINQFAEDKKWNIGVYFVNMLTLLFSTIGFSFSSYGDTFRALKKKEQRKINRNILFAVTGVAAAVGILMIILPLLLTSDAVFRRIFGDLFFDFSLFSLISRMDNTIEIVVLVMVGFALMYGLFYASCHAGYQEEYGRKVPVCPAAMGITFSSIIAAVYLLYSGIQIVVLFFRNRGALPEGMTYSAYAHEGFWQLVLVAMINIGMVLFCKYLFEKNKIFHLILTVISLCTFVMMASAAFRMYLYVETYHMTFLRLLVFWFLFILALIMCGVVVTIYKETFSFIQYGIWVAVCGYIVFSLMRPDYFVAKYNVNHIEEMSEMDVQYMVYNLSLDAAPVVAEIDTSNMEWTDSYSQAQIDETLYSYFKEISENNQGIYFRKANYSRIMAKRAADLYLLK